MLSLRYRLSDSLAMRYTCYVYATACWYLVLWSIMLLRTEREGRNVFSGRTIYYGCQIWNSTMPSADTSRVPMLQSATDSTMGIIGLLRLGRQSTTRITALVKRVQGL